MISGAMVGMAFYKRDFHDIGYQFAHWAWMNVVNELPSLNLAHESNTDVIIRHFRSGS